jgi:hypothetical protein
MSATVLVQSPHRSHTRNRVLAFAAAFAIVTGGTVLAASAIDDSGTKQPTSVETPAPAPAVSHAGHDHVIGRGATTPGALDTQLTLHDGRR